jgi:ADP-ribosylglycohydrolase
MTLSKLDRARGSLAGLCIGDALGRPVEGMSISEIEAKFGVITEFLDDKIEGTDDTEFAILTASTLIKYGLAATQDDFASGWLTYVCKQESPLIGAGFSELSTVKNLLDGFKPPYSGFHAASWSDGLAMRIAPVGIAANADMEIVRRLSEADGSVSNAGEGIVGGTAVAIAVAMAINGATVEQIFGDISNYIPMDSWLHRNLELVRTIYINRGNKTDSQIRHELSSAIAIFEFPFPELAPEAVALAFSALLFGAGEFEKTLLFAVNLGRDTDTIAAICGAICGAQVGFQALPVKWSSQLGAATGSCLDFAAGVNLVELAPELLAIGDLS